MPEKRALDIGPDTCLECEFTWDYLLENGCMNPVNCVRNVDCAALTTRRHERNAVAEEPPKSVEQEIEEFATVFFSIDDIVPVLRSMARRIDVLENHKACAEHDGRCPDCGEMRATVAGLWRGDCPKKRRDELADHCAWSQAERPEQL